jgi:hypothetical protein
MSILSKLRSLFSSPQPVSISVEEDEGNHWALSAQHRANTILPPAMPASQCGDVPEACLSLAPLSADVFVERILARHMSFPLPAIYRTDDGPAPAFKFSWRTRDGKHLDIEFRSDGLCEWFYRDATNNITHAVDVPVDVPRLHHCFWECVDLIHASIDDYMLEDDRDAYVSMFQNLCGRLGRTYYE